MKKIIYNFSGSSVKYKGLNADDIRYLNKKRVYGTSTGWLIPSGLLGIPAYEGWAPVVGGNPLGEKSPVAVSAINSLALSTVPGMAPVWGSLRNVGGVNDFEAEQRSRKAKGKDIPMPSEDELAYMNAKLRYEDSTVGRHPWLTGIVSPMYQDVHRGIQPRGKAALFGYGIPALAGAAAAIGGNEWLDLGDEDSTLLGLGAGMLSAPISGSIYNATGKSAYLKEKARRKAAGKPY